jgi:hypothetical protein
MDIRHDWIIWDSHFFLGKILPLREIDGTPMVAPRSDPFFTPSFSATDRANKLGVSVVLPQPLPLQRMDRYPPKIRDGA